MIKVDQQYNLILIDGVDKTAAIDSWTPERNNLIWITYKNHKSYRYGRRRVQIFTEPQKIDISDMIVIRQNVAVKNVATILVFGNICRLVFTNGHFVTCPIHEVELCSSSLDEPQAGSVFEYLKSIADAVGISFDDYNILSSQFSRIEQIPTQCVLTDYLRGYVDKNFCGSDKKLIFPFGFNLSQIEAVNNAFSNRVSVIEGPPGTGKTQTILNVIANAVMRGKTVAVVSNNNSAIENVYQKLQQYGFDFIVAFLGKNDNKEEFLKNQSSELPDISHWSKKPIMLSYSLIVDLQKQLQQKRNQAELLKELDSIKKEKVQFEQHCSCEDNPLTPLRFSKRATSAKLLSFVEEYTLLLERKRKICFLRKLFLKWKYGIKGKISTKQDIKAISDCCHRKFYELKLDEINKRIADVEKQISDFDARMNKCRALSLQQFKYYLYQRYSGKSRHIYSEKELVFKSSSFLKDYPVVLSTTYSLTNCLSRSTMFDYVIIDESSQVDLATGALALSCAKKAVIVGDTKQLPNIVDSAHEKIVDAIFENYNLAPAYKFSNHSILSSVTELFADVPKVVLREHYRCHPDIIEFCNRKFYNDQLIVMSKPFGDKNAMAVYRTVAGNLARGHLNERQVEVILNEVLPQQCEGVEKSSIGIVTPYRAQAQRLKNVFVNTGIKADTVDKFQGQERDVMIFSTVDNQIGDFVSNPNRLNVAISRAKNKFILVTDGNENDSASAIHELIQYIEYNNGNIVDSKIESVFDYLYTANAVAREKILKKYGRVSEFDSENLMYVLIRSILSEKQFDFLGVVMHVPLYSIIRDFSILSEREKQFAQNDLSHVDFLIYSKITHRPVLIVEVDGFAYHSAPKQKERDSVKDSIFSKYGVPLLRLNTTESSERARVVCALQNALKNNQ